MQLRGFRFSSNRSSLRVPVMGVHLISLPKVPV
jgi:hypothetical protein